MKRMILMVALVSQTFAFAGIANAITSRRSERENFIHELCEARDGRKYAPDCEDSFSGLTNEEISELTVSLRICAEQVRNGGPMIECFHEAAKQLRRDDLKKHCPKDATSRDTADICHLKFMNARRTEDSRRDRDDYSNRRYEATR
jgi:hypothetical protein